MDVTASPLLASPKNKKGFTAAVLVAQASKQIICTTYAKRKVDDFQLFKTSFVKLPPTVECLANQAYQGIQRLAPHSRTRKKKPRGSQLPTEQKRAHRQYAQLRVICEHLNRRLQVFKILSERYRNRRRFGLRFNLIAGLYNYELTRRYLTFCKNSTEKRIPI